MQQRKDEILAKKARLAELKRQREQRSKDFSANRQSIGAAIEVPNLRSTNSKETRKLTSAGLAIFSKPYRVSQGARDVHLQSGRRGQGPGHSSDTSIRASQQTLFIRRKPFKGAH